MIVHPGSSRARLAELYKQDLAPGRQQATRLGAGVGRPVAVFIGDNGMLLGNGKLLPEEKFKDFQTPPETLPRSPGHWVE